MNVNYLRTFSQANIYRCETAFKHAINSWSASDWMTATIGELGEAANIIKKLNRIRDGVPNKETETELKIALEKELADTYTYLDLLATSQGIDLHLAVVNKFNEISERRGWPYVIDLVRRFEVSVRDK